MYWQAFETENDLQQLKLIRNRNLKLTAKPPISCWCCNSKFSQPIISNLVTPQLLDTRELHSQYSPKATIHVFFYYSLSRQLFSAQLLH